MKVEEGRTLNDYKARSHREEMQPHFSSEMCLQTLEMEEAELKWMVQRS